MIVKDAYIQLQQGLQNIAAFVYSDIKLPEFDYFWNNATSKFIELAFPDLDDNGNPIKRDERYDDIQASIDDLRVLEVLGYTNTIVPFTQGNNKGSYLQLPDNYRHLLNDRTIVKVLNCATDETREVPNRLSRAANIPNELENTYYKTALGSPISRQSGGRLYVYNTYKNIDQFTINNIIIDYLRNPVNVAYGVDGSSIIEFPDYVCYKIIQLTLVYISIVTEQNLNKIQQLIRQ